MFSDVVEHVRDELKQIETYMAEVEKERIEHVSAADSALTKLEAARSEQYRLEKALKALHSEPSEKPTPRSLPAEDIVSMPYLPER